MALNAAEIILRVRNEQLKQELEESKNALQDFRNEQTSKFRSMVAGIAAAFSVVKMVGWASGWIEDAQRANEITAILDQTIKATGNSAGLTTEQMVELADSLQKVTKFESEVTQEAMAVLASFRNVKGDIFSEAIVSAQDMATVLKTDLSSAAMQLGKALNDPVDGLTKLARSGVTFSDAQKKQVEEMVKLGDVAGAQKIILAELAHEFGGTAEAAGAESWEPLKNQLGDIGEEIGNKLIPLIRSLVPVFQGVMTYVSDTVLPYWTETFTNMGDTASWLGDFLGTVWEFIVVGFQGAIMVVSFVWESAFEAMKVVAYGFAYGVVSSLNEVVHLFSDTIPEVLTWLSENWTTILDDMMSYTGTVFSNMLSNVTEFFAGLKRLLSGGSADFEFRALTEGFEATLTKLPELTERVPTEMEKSLKAEMAKSMEAIKTNWSTGVDTMIDASNSILRRDTNPSAPKTKDSKPEWLGKLGGGKGHELDVPEEKKKKEKEEKEASGGIETVESMIARITGNVGFGKADPDEALKENTAALTQATTVEELTKQHYEAVANTQQSISDQTSELLAATREVAANTSMMVGKLMDLILKPPVKVETKPGGLG